MTLLSGSLGQELLRGVRRLRAPGEGSIFTAGFTCPMRTRNERSDPAFGSVMPAAERKRRHARLGTDEGRAGAA